MKDSSKINYPSIYFLNLKKCIDEISHEDIEKVVETIHEAYLNNKQVFIMGNGGSASTASHFACDLGKNTVVDDKPRLRVISLTDNVPLMTALSNDFGYDRVFTEQLTNLLNRGDVVIAITGSGNSPNILNAIEYAKSVGAVTVGMLGFGGGKAKDIVDHHITISSTNYGHVEDVHMILEHLITGYFHEKIKI